MTTPELSLPEPDFPWQLGAIWAQSRDGIIGDGLGMPWHIPADLQLFQRQTRGHDVLMGRATWESLPKKFRPLPQRRNIVLSHQRPGEWSEGAEVFSQLEDALAALERPAWVIGGGSVYSAVMPFVDYLCITTVDIELGEKLGTAAVHAPAPAGFIPVATTPSIESGGYRIQAQSLRAQRECVTIV